MDNGGNLPIIQEEIIIFTYPMKVRARGDPKTPPFLPLPFTGLYTIFYK